MSVIKFLNKQIRNYDFLYEPIQLKVKYGSYDGTTIGGCLSLVLCGLFLAYFLLLYQ